ncbi:MAG: apolipoprotein N-acyltransferase [Actinomycetota bacterium]|nr:apolipoprotein N-acyltransferase [Actinomycetota bacterium]
MSRLGTYAAVLVGGGALALAFPEPDLAPVAWIALVPLLVSLRRAPPGRALRLGIAFGLSFFGALLSWISLVGWVAWAVLIALESLFVGAFGLAFSYSSRAGAVLRVASAPVLWVAAEYLRARVPLGGFTWGQLAQSQHNLAWMLKPAAFAGGWAVAFVVVGVNALMAEAWIALVDRRIVFAAASTGLAALLVGLPALVPQIEADGRPIKVAIVQGNVPRDFEGDVFDKELKIISSHERLTARLDQPVDLVVWPESSLGIDIDENSQASEAVRGAAVAADAPMIVGGNLDVDSDHYRVMAFLVDAQGAIVDRYQKTHLVPFGEYVPARSYLDWIPMLDQVPRDAVAGREKTVFGVAGGQIAPVVSYEGDFGSLVRSRIDSGGRMLVVATNTSTWGESWASAQHVAFSKVRAVENGVWVIHAALSGISAFIAPNGSVFGTAPLWTATTSIHEVRFATEPSFYARTGDWLPVACLLLAVVMGAALLVRGRTRP